MRDISGPRLVSEAVCAGAMAFLGTAGGDSQFQSKRVQETQQLALLRCGTRSPEEQRDVLHRIGIGCIVGATRETTVEQDEGLIKGLLDGRPSSLWLTIANNSHLGRAVAIAKRSAREQDRHTSVFVQVSCPEDALEAAESGADVLVLRGDEARGPFLGCARESLAELFPATDRILENGYRSSKTAQGFDRPLLLAAGGIRSGEDLCWALDLGFDGVCMGSRFEVSEESALPDDLKRQEAQMLGLSMAETEVKKHMQMVKYILGDVIEEAAAAINVLAS
jgi:NAD(P)H-dependent flavin oxidoreductase YrpB (nitropropane dioxygenase family)